jgi:hypothetical protein
LAHAGAGHYLGVLFPLSERLSWPPSGAMYAELDSQYGHGGFLLETAAITHFSGIILCAYVCALGFMLRNSSRALAHREHH